jgi:spore coat protein A
MRRRKFLNGWPLIVMLVCLSSMSPPGVLAQQTQLPGNKIPQFVDPLPLLSIAGGPIETIVAGAAEITLNMLEFKANVMPSTFVPATGTYSGTWVFGYRVGPTTAPTTPVGTYIGPVIVATRNQPTQIRYVNNLRANNIHWRDWIDQSLHWANPCNVPMETSPGIGNTARYVGPVSAVPHLHGGEVPGVIDGGPEAWFLSDEAVPSTCAPVTTQGGAYYTKAGAAANEAIYRYPNSQEAAPLWFHDHLLGATRINATFAGLAGAYPIIDTTLTLPTGLDPVGLGGRLLIPLVLQDRMFDTNGQLFFPNVGINPEHPVWVPEFVGDTIVVNGKVWPYLNVDQQRYRFYLINGSNSRPYELFLQDLVSRVKGPRMWVIATDGGYLDTPVLIDPNATQMSGIPKSLVMMPGERYEIIIDFADPEWKALLPKKVTFPLNLVLRNTAATTSGNPVANTEGRIMQFRVSASAPADTSYDPATLTPIRTGTQTIHRLVNPNTGTLAAGVSPNLTRQLTLNEVGGSGGPLEALVNNSQWDGIRLGSDPPTPIPGSLLVRGNWLTELPNEGATEVWEIVNLTEDSHPIHLHGVQFQILNRQPFDKKAYDAVYAGSFPGGGFIPGYGPPLGYAPSLASGGKYGGNPNVDPYLEGTFTPPLPFEAGWKDTAIMPPDHVTRIAVRFAPNSTPINGAPLYFTYNPSANNGYYVWHCHITDHEDNEMMRPYQFQPAPGAVRTYVLGIDY